MTTNTPTTHKEMDVEALAQDLERNELKGSFFPIRETINALQARGLLATLKNPSDAGGLDGLSEDDITGLRAYLEREKNNDPWQIPFGKTRYVRVVETLLNIATKSTPTPPQADTPIKGAGELKPYFIARLENLRSEYAHENGTVEADTGYFLAKDEHAESYLEGIDRCIELLQDTASSQDTKFCGFPLVMDYMLPPEVIEIRAHNGEVMAHVLLDDVKEIAGNGY